MVSLFAPLHSRTPTMGLHEEADEVIETRDYIFSSDTGLDCHLLVSTWSHVSLMEMECGGCRWS